MLNRVRFLALLLAALTFVPTGAHLAELPHKMMLSATEYLTVQQIYRGWDLFGLVIGGEIASLVALIIMLRRRARSIALASTALALMVGTQVIFWGIHISCESDDTGLDWTLRTRRGARLHGARLEDVERDGEVRLRPGERGVLVGRPGVAFQEI